MSEYDDEFPEETLTPADNVLVDEDKITITLPLSTLRQIADSAAYAAASTIERRIDKIIAKQIDGILNAKLEALVGDRATAIVEEWLTKPRQRFDTWGTPIAGIATSLADVIPSTVESYLNAKVDTDGRGYSSGKASRLDWIVGKIVREPLDVEIKTAASKVSEMAKKVVAESVGKYVAEQLAPSIDAKTLLQQGR